MQITVYAELSQSYASQHPNYVANIAYLLKPGASQNELKPDKTSRSQPKQPKKITKRPEMILNFKIGEIWNFLLAFLSQILSPNTQI